MLKHSFIFHLLLHHVYISGANMYPKLPPFNWSLQRALSILPDSFAKAKVRIIYSIILFSILKAFVVIAFAFLSDQWLQLLRAMASLVVYIVVIKLLLTNPHRIKWFAHILLVGGLIMIWSNALVFIHNLNLPAVQFAFMIMLGSFYILGSRAGVIYSIIAIVPFLIYSFFPEGFGITNFTEQLASPGFEIIAILNFITIVVSHYYFYRAFDENIKEKEQLNKQLEITAAEAKKLAQSRADFLATMTHELRTPLNSVVGVTELMLRERPEEKFKENLDILRYSASDLLSLVNNILDLNKLDSHKVQLESMPVNLYHLISNVCSVLMIKARDKQVKLVLNIDKRLENITVMSDPTRLLQVMYNLVGNAIKFTHQGSVTVSLQLIEEDTNIAKVMFTIEDTGIGIAAEKQHLIFDMFSQAEQNTTRKYGGTGLGLTIVQQVLKMFNSSVRLESSLGNGSKFNFEITFKTTANTGISIEDKPTPNLGKLKVLVAEDNDINKLVLQKQLESLGVSSFVMVADGEQAYEQWTISNYDIVLLDLDMPGWNGYDAVNKMRSYHYKKQQSYLVAFTASVHEQQHIIAHGFDDFLYKPVSISALRHTLEKGSVHNQNQNIVESPDNVHITENQF